MTRFAPRRARGFSIIELMTAITIGLVILVGLSSVFVNSSTSFRELRKTSEQIENGRYAIETMSQDIRHAGFYGALWKLPALPVASDPCDLPTDGTISDTQNNFLSLPIDVWPAANLTSTPTIPGSCGTWLTANNLMPGSDIVVVRRVESQLATSTVAGRFYLQATASDADLQLATATGAIASGNNARGAATGLFRRDVTQAATGTPPTFPQTAAHIRRFRTHIYFVAPCSTPGDGSDICTGTSSDDQGRAIPTLKRLEMTGGTAATLFSVVPIAEGIQTMRVEYGVDDSPSTVDPGTALIGDSVPDWFTTNATARSLANLSNAVAARIYVLARNTEPTSGYKDDKTYTLGSVTTTAANDTYKRHVYGAETRIINAAGRREIPR